MTPGAHTDRFRLELAFDGGNDFYGLKASIERLYFLLEPPRSVFVGFGGGIGSIYSGIGLIPMFDIVLLSGALIGRSSDTQFEVLFRLDFPTNIKIRYGGSGNDILKLREKVGPVGDRSPSASIGLGILW